MNRIDSFIDGQLAGSPSDQSVVSAADKGPNASQSERAAAQGPEIDLNASLDRLADTVDERMGEYRQMLSALEAVEQWFFDANVPTGVRERALLEQIRAAIRVGRAQS